jgi:hypothetical protein
MRPYGERSGESQKVLVEWLERVGPEFKLQYCKKKTKQKKHGNSTGHGVTHL